MRRLLLGLLLLVVAAAVVPGLPARAESGHKDKPVGDAPAAIDITAIDADNRQRRVKVELTVPGLGETGTFTFGYEGRYYDGMAIIVHKRGDRVVRKAWHCGEESCAKVRCPGIHVRWDIARRVVGVSVPQSCYPLRIPEAWHFNGHSELGGDYDTEYTRLVLRRG